MRFLSLLLLVLLLSAFALAQQHYLVSPNQEVIPLTKWQRAAHLIEARSHTVAGRTASGVAGCTNQFTFGYTEDLFVPSSRFGIYHHDVLGQWYVAKATGTIDSLFWDSNGNVGAAVMDSTVNVRIHHSVIGPNYGPGIRPGLFDPPCQNWGYWVNLNDQDQGVAAFPEDANPFPGPFHSTIAHGTAGPPFGTEIWGFGGFPVTMHVGRINEVAMQDLAEACSVSVGEVFFVNFKTVYPAPIHYYPDTRTEFAAAGVTVTTSDENYPSRDWKFYEHDSGPSNCAGVPVNNVKRGWVARGGFGTDTTDVGMYNIWYTMTVSSNTPPDVRDAPGGVPHNTLSTGPQQIQVNLTDCDPASPGLAGIDHAQILWSLDHVPQSPIAMDPVVGPLWEGTVPGQAAGHTIDYTVKAYDLEGAANFGVPHEYRIVNLLNAYYVIDTLSSCANTSILNTGTAIDTSKFFNDQHGATNPKDDGQAGPFNMFPASGPFVFFGDTVRYAWVGTNGAIALSKSATDTLDITATGAYSPNWTFPEQQRHGHLDTINQGLPPKNFICPFYADLIIGDSAGQYGQILHGNDGDPCKFIVEYDSIGTFLESTGAPFKDNTTFRVILNRCTGTIKFEYNIIGTQGQDSAALVGMQADSNTVTAGYPGAVPGFVFLNRNAFPIETKPSPNTCLQFTPGAALYAKVGWNLLSVSYTRQNSDYNPNDVYIGASSKPFKYANAYQIATTLTNGKGYWLKYTNPMYAGAPGYLLPAIFDTVTSGWNMIGTPSSPVPVNTVVPVNCTISTNFFGYNGSGYQLVNGVQTLNPALGYWAKVTSVSAGVPGLTLTGTTNLPKEIAGNGLEQMDEVVVRSAAGASQSLYLGSESSLKLQVNSLEMPPSMSELTGFDARFSSGRIAETYPAQFTATGRYEYPISIQTGNYPVTITMNRTKESAAAVKIAVRTTQGQLLGTLDGTHSMVKITNASVKTVVLTVNDKVNVPKSYALSQNYPNPFNPSTKFNVDIPKASSVNVTVYDLLGQRITTLMTGDQAPGSVTVQWDGRDANGLTVPSGVYFVRMQSDNFTATQKIMLMKECIGCISVVL